MRGTADFYEIKDYGVRWLGSILRNGDPYAIPYDILEQSPESFDYWLSKVPFSCSDEWPHLWNDSLCTEYIYYIDFGLINSLSFSYMEDIPIPHSRVYNFAGIRYHTILEYVNSRTNVLLNSIKNYKYKETFLTFKERAKNIKWIT